MTALHVWPHLGPRYAVTATSYFAAFDATRAIGTDLVLDEKYHPGAASALAAWASDRNLQTERLYESAPWSGMLRVQLGRYGTVASRSIDVYLRGES